MTKRLAVVFLLTAAMTLAQQTGVNGKVTDATKAVVANATVLATGSDGSRTNTTTSSQGLYQLPTLRAGQYVLRFEAPGFAPVEKTITLLVGQVADVEISLQVASTSSTVAVEATA